MGLVYLQLAFGRHGKLEGTYIYHSHESYGLWNFRQKNSEMKKAIIRDPAWDLYYYPPQVVADTVHVYIYIYYSNDILWYDLVYKYMIINIYDMISYFFVDVIVSASVLYTAILIQIYSP